eukprot:5259324-Ditylum_brightwellii.AAC.1
MELQGLLEHLMNDKKVKKEIQHVVIPLLGEFKGERGECWHLALMADVMTSGFRPAEGRTAGPVMCNSKRELLTSSQVEKEFHAQLARVQLSHPLLIDPTIDGAKLYGIS